MTPTQRVAEPCISLNHRKTVNIPPIKTEQSECAWKLHGKDSKSRFLRWVVVSKLDQLDLVGYDDLARLKVDGNLHYLGEHTATCKWSEGSRKPEERIYRRGLPDGYHIPLEIDQTIAIINKLLKTYITHEHDVKRFVYNDVTDQILVIAEVMHGCKDSNEQIAEPNSHENYSNH